MTIDPNKFVNPKASGAYMRVIIGISKIPTICDIIGADMRTSTSEV
jgi:hypothetical protein